MYYNSHSPPAPHTQNWLFDEDKGSYGTREGDGMAGLEGGVVSATCLLRLKDELTVVFLIVELSSCQDVYWRAD